MSITDPPSDRIRVDVAPAFAPLLPPARYKGAYGGRGGAKSHFFAEQLLVRCYVQPTRAVCIREVQNSIRDSVRQLLVDKIQKLGFGPFFDILEAEIRGSNGSLIIFKGMQSFNAETIKSLEAYDIAWVEEAQTFSEKSLELLRPTIRQEESEIWFSWNPRYRDDPVDMFFRKSPVHPEAVSVFVNWRDNPWFPEVLRREMQHDMAADPELAEHTWEGAYGIEHGSYYGRLIARAEGEKRITAVPYVPASLVTTAWDLGKEDSTAIWFAQRVALQWRILDYYEAAGQDLAHFVGVLREKSYRYAEHILPHDARQDRLGAPATIEKQLQDLGLRPTRVLPNTDIPPGIEAARRLLPQCWFDEQKCARGLEALRHYHAEWDEDRKAFKQRPVHDWASDGADAFRYLALGLRELPKKAERRVPARGETWMSAG